MRILFVADGRSPIALNWIRTVIARGHEVHLVSTFPCQPFTGLASLQVIPVAGSGLVGERGASAPAEPEKARLRRTLRAWIPVWLRTAVRQRLGQATIPGAVRQLIPIIQRLEPEVIHAMRIPYEGILAAGALDEINGPPLLLSVWGNDFTLHAGSNRYLRRATRQALQRADGLHADCQRDIRLGRAWGYGPDSPAWVLPGGGGIQLDLFRPATTPGKPHELVINPRGIRAYIQNDTFFRAIPLVLAGRPQVRFVCPNMAGESLAERWI